MRCLHCRKQLPPEALFCAYCGTVVRPAAPPAAPLPVLALNRRALARAGRGWLWAALIALALWLVIGALAGLSLTAAALIGAGLGSLAAGLGGWLEPGLLWPASHARPVHNGAARLGLIYGIGGGLPTLLGGPPIGLTVLTQGWQLSVPVARAVVAGAFAGGVASVISAAAAALSGGLLGWLLGLAAGRLGGRVPPAVMVALAWLASGTLGGAAVGALVASRTELPTASGVVMGALVQLVLNAVLLPAALRVVRLAHILFSRWP